MVLITAKSRGTVTVTITNDDGQFSTSITFTFTVPNSARPGEHNTPANPSLRTDSGNVRVPITPHLADPDGDPVSLGGIQLSAPDVVGVNITGDDLILTPWSAGTTIQSLTAWAGSILSSVDGTIKVPNRAPIVTFPLEAHTLNHGPSISHDANPLFSDPDGDALTFTAVSSDSSIVNATSTGNVVSFQPQECGGATLTFTAHDGLTSMPKNFNVMVNNSAPGTPHALLT